MKVEYLVCIFLVAIPLVIISIATLFNVCAFTFVILKMVLEIVEEKIKNRRRQCVRIRDVH